MRKPRSPIVSSGELLRQTPDPSVRQYHASIMHDIMVRNPFPAETIDAMKALSLDVRRRSEAHALLIKTKSEARLTLANVKLLDSGTAQ